MLFNYVKLIGSICVIKWYYFRNNPARINLIIRQTIAIHITNSRVNGRNTAVSGLRNSWHKPFITLTSGPVIGILAKIP